MEGVRLSITFIGRVQGVGFRATTQDIARRHGLTGWVRNELGGSVRCVVEGDPRKAEQFLNELKVAMERNIREVRLEKSAATGEFAAFRIER